MALVWYSSSSSMECLAKIVGAKDFHVTQPFRSSGNETKQCKLPPELLVHIFGFLQNPRALCSLSCVNRAFNELSSDDSLWKPLCSPDWEDKNPSPTTWKAKYLDFLRKAVSLYSHGPDRTASRKPQVNSMGFMQKNTDPSLPYDFMLKIALIGEQRVGKSSLLLRFTEDTFPETYIPTIGVDSRLRILNVKGTRVNLQVWDSAGQQRHRLVPIMLAQFYRQIHAILIVYDVTDRHSFEEVKVWLEEKEKYASKIVVPMLVGNKADLTDQRRVESKEGEELAKELNIPFFVETSAQTGEGVEEAFSSALVEFVLGIFTEKAGYWNRCVQIAAERKKNIPKVVPSVEDLDALGIVCFYQTHAKNLSVEKKNNFVCF